MVLFRLPMGLITKRLPIRPASPMLTLIRQSRNSIMTLERSRIHDPKGVEQVTAFDSVGRVSQQTYKDSVNNVDGTHVRLVYRASQSLIKSYSLLQSGA